MFVSFLMEKNCLKLQSHSKPECRWTRGPNFQRMTTGTHGDEVGASIELLTFAHAGAHGLRCLQQWRRSRLTSFRQRKIHSKMCKDIYMVFLMSKHQPTPTRQGILILFCKKETRRGELFASMQTSNFKSPPYAPAPSPSPPPLQRQLDIDRCISI